MVQNHGFLMPGVCDIAYEILSQRQGKTGRDAVVRADKHHAIFNA